MWRGFGSRRGGGVDDLSVRREFQPWKGVCNAGELVVAREAAGLGWVGEGLWFP